MRTLDRHAREQYKKCLVEETKGMEPEEKREFLSVCTDYFLCLDTHPPKSQEKDVYSVQKGIKF